MRKIKYIIIALLVTIITLTSTVPASAGTKLCASRLEIKKSKYPYYIYHIYSDTGMDRYQIRVYTDKSLKKKYLQQTCGFDKQDVEDDTCWNVYEGNETIYAVIDGWKGKTYYKSKYLLSCNKKGVQHCYKYNTKKKKYL